MTTPQPIPANPPTPPMPGPVGQPVTPVDFFRRMPGGGTVYVKATDPLLCLRARSDGYAPTCGQIDHCPSCQLCADVHTDTCPYHPSRHPLPEPDACAACDTPKAEHAQRWTPALRWHNWVPPITETRKTRMLARRAARTQETPR